MAEILDSRILDEELTELEDDFANLHTEDLERLEILRNLRDEVGDEWAYGATLIPDEQFVEYAQQLADDLGLVDNGVSWPFTCIDWEQAADELKNDYTIIEFDRVDYWVHI